VSWRPMRCRAAERSFMGTWRTVRRSVGWGSNEC